MVIPKDELQDFAHFLSAEYQAEPMCLAGDGGELLRAIVNDQTVIVLDLNDGGADVWCSEADSLTEIWSAWCGYRQPV